MASESSISRERARAILTAAGQPDLYTPGSDYYVRTTDDGEERLEEWGQDEPLAVNRTNTSWLS
jgi:hypothetical protein